MEFLIVYLTCSYDRSAEPCCSTSQEVVDADKAQDIIEANKGVKSAPQYKIRETEIFTSHSNCKKSFKKIIVMRVE